MTNDTDLTTSTIRNSLVVIRDLLKKSRENGDAELHWIQINRLFEELKSDVLPLVENEKSQGVEFEEMPIVKLLKEIDDSVWFPLAWEYKQDLTFRSVKEEFEISDCIPEIPDAPFPQDTVDCAFITDDGYVNMTAVAINSIRRTRNPKTKIRIHVVAAALSEYSEKLFKLFEETDFSIDVVRIEKSVLEKLSSYHQYIKGGHCMATPAALLKFALPELLPNLNRVLYLDGDTLILRDLKTLFQTKLGENYVAAVTDSWVATNDGDTIQVLGKWLFNSGMMLLNLSLMRKHNMSKTLLDAKKRSTDYRLMDQPIFNTLLAGRVRFVDYRYNFLPVWYWRKKGLLKKEEFKNKFSEIYGKTLSEPEEMLSTDITIAHFAGSDKPWTNSQLPFAKEWLDRAAELDEMRLREFVTGDFQPTVSIIIPVYNVEKYLQECLDSIIKQNLKEIEIICIDDGSTDSSPVILKEYAAQDPRIKILKQQNRGQGAARNLGIKKARGKYIGFVDSDDWVSKNYFEKLFTAAQKNNADVTSTTGVFLSCGTKADVRKSVGIELGTNLLSDLDRYATILTTGITVNKLYRRDFLTDNNILFPEKRVFGEDNFVVFFSVMLANKIACVHDANYYYRQRENSTVTQQISDWFFTIIDAYRVIFDRIKTSNLNAKAFSTACKRAYNDCLAVFKKFSPQRRMVFSEMIRNQLPEIRHERIFEYEWKTPKSEALQIIISLTSFPGRIKTVNQTVETLLAQTWNADRIVLWLAESQFPKKERELPKKLLALRERGLEIRWCEDLRSYKKLVPALKEFPNDIIVTADDDLLYPRNWLEPLVFAFLKNPNHIHTRRAHEVAFANTNTLAPYAKWEKEIGSHPPSFNNFPTSGGGCLFPPNSLHDDVLDVSKFQSLCPNGDDIWFWAMAVKKGTKINVPEAGFTLHFVEGTQNVALWKENVNGGENDRALSRILETYPEILEKLDRIYPSTTPKSPRVRKDSRLSAGSLETEQKRLPRFLVRLGAMFIWNKAARKRWREEHMDLTPRNGIDIHAHPELRRDSALKRLAVRTAALFIFSKSKRKAFRAKHLNLAPRDGVDVESLSPEARRLRKQKKRERNPLRRLFNALVPATRSKLSHAEKRLTRHMEWQTQQLLTALKTSQAQAERRLGELKKELSQLRERNSALEAKLDSVKGDLARCVGDLSQKTEEAKLALENSLKAHDSALSQQVAEARNRLFWFTDYRVLGDAFPELYEKLRENNPYATKEFQEELFKSGIHSQRLEGYENWYSNLIRSSFGYKDSLYFESISPEDRERELKLWFKLRNGYDLDLKNPKTFNEKIQWLKLYDATSLKRRLADKYEVREWVKEQIGEKYLVPLLGVYDSFDAIDFDALPEKFVIKTTHGSGFNIIVKDKSEFDKADAKKKLDGWLALKFEYCGCFEMHYAGMKPRIIIEEFLDIDEDSTYEWQAFCFNGEVKFFMIIVGGAHAAVPGARYYYDVNWKKLPFTSAATILPAGEIARPENFSELLSCVKKLCKDFLHVRVDFYRLKDGNWKFGEMTFTSASGTWKVYPKKYDRIVGDMLKLPEKD